MIDFLTHLIKFIPVLISTAITFVSVFPANEAKLEQTVTAHIISTDYPPRTDNTAESHVVSFGNRTTVRKVNKQQLHPSVSRRVFWFVQQGVYKFYQISRLIL